MEEDGTVTVGDLAVGETVTITASYTVTSDDIKAGHVLNAVTAAGDPIEDPKNPDEPKKPEGKDEEDDETDDLDTALTVDEELRRGGRRDGGPGRDDQLHDHGEE